MAGINNKYDYRSGVLTALGVEHTPSDVRNEDEYRKKVLDGFGVEYTDDDINRKNLYRAKIVNGLASGGGGGSSDFSTANVTITNNSDTDWQTQFASLENIGVGEHPDVIVCNTQGIPARSVNDYKIIMYKNYTGLRSQSTATVEVSGNAELIGRVIAITGDCTITIS